jgi:hypothetical protein
VNNTCTESNGTSIFISSERLSLTFRVRLIRGKISIVVKL